VNRERQLEDRDYLALLTLQVCIYDMVKSH